LDYIYIYIYNIFTYNLNNNKNWGVQLIHTKLAMAHNLRVMNLETLLTASAICSCLLCSFEHE
jgi:hypothetical protein